MHLPRCAQAPVSAVFPPARKLQFGPDAAGGGADGPEGGGDTGQPMFLALRCSDGEDLLGGVQRTVLLPSAHSVARAAGGASHQGRAPPSVCFSIDAAVYAPLRVRAKEPLDAGKLAGSRVVVVDG